jgi:predicted membrane-bound spermidine synthase
MRERASASVGRRYRGPSPKAVLAGVSFLSGCAALLFESLWFRQTLLAFGSSVWASSLVLSSFMAGVALGNAAAARLGTRVRRPVLAYASLELVVAALGAALVVLLPELGPSLAPVFRPLLGTDALLQPLRFALCFVVLLGPAAAMGATLPLLVHALSRRPEDFGGTLAALYGWNTLGAVLGALAGEVCLLAPLGVVGTAAAAGSVNLLAAGGALALLRSNPEDPTLGIAAEATRAPGARAVRLLFAGFLSGAILLALEVVWFRLLLLFVEATARGFAVMLAVVLAGIGLGSLAAAAWMRREPGADRHLWAVALAAGAVGIFGYGQLGIALGGEVWVRILSPTGLAVASILMLPAAAASGALFSLIGKSLNDSLLVPVRSAGLITLVNTLGAAIGPLVAGFVLLPRLGVEVSVLVLCAGYGLVALLCAQGAAVRAARLAALPALAFVAALATFPFGRMDDRYLDLAAKKLVVPGAEIVARREGLTETIQYSRLSFLGEPVLHQLLTNGYWMSGTTLMARRYMSLFAYLPAALHAAPRDALLISYGVGVTAKSLTLVEGLRSIDVVDVSRDILEMSDVVFPDPTEHPLRDPRVRVHVEDGRYFLQTTSGTFDLITAEPPPPRQGNVTYLYTEEYFQLARDRLRPGGLLSYWLPADQLSREEVASIAGAFCAVFEDCSLWNGGTLNWILLGSRGGLAPLVAGSLGRHWQNPATAADLRAIGVESPAALGALFVADAGQLRELTRHAPPLRDAFPLRIHNWIPPVEKPGGFLEFQDSRACRSRFLESGWIRRVWPDALRRETLRHFRATGLLDRIVGQAASQDEAIRLGILRAALETFELRVLALLALSEDPQRVEIAERRREEAPASAEIERMRANGALARREWSRAAAHYRAALSLGAERGRAGRLALYAHCRAGEDAQVDALRRELLDGRPDPGPPPGLAREPGIDGCWAAAWGFDPRRGRAVRPRATGRARGAGAPVSASPLPPRR